MIYRQNYKSLIETTIGRIKNPHIYWLQDITSFGAHLFNKVVKGGYPTQQASVNENHVQNDQ